LHAHGSGTELGDKLVEGSKLLLQGLGQLTLRSQSKCVYG
jgi:hypothetical protein